MTAETELADLETEANSPAVVSNASRALELHQAQETKRAEIDRLYARWAELESLRGGG